MRSPSRCVHRHTRFPERLMNGHQATADHRGPRRRRRHSAPPPRDGPAASTARLAALVVPSSRNERLGGAFSRVPARWTGRVPERLSCPRRRPGRDPDSAGRPRPGVLPAMSTTPAKGAFLRDVSEQPSAVEDTLTALAGDPTLLDRLARLRQRGDTVVLTGMGSSLAALYPTHLRLLAAGLPAVLVEAG